MVALALPVAAATGRLADAAYALAQEPDINEADERGCTPLHYAIYGGYEEVVSLLLASGADVNQADKHGYTPLHLAAENGDEQVVQLLLKNGALRDVVARNS